MTINFVKNSSYSDKEKEEILLKIESIQDVINKRFEEFINTTADISEEPDKTLEKYPNKEENAIQKSLKKQTLFSKIKLSLLEKIRGAIKNDVKKEKGDDSKER